MPIPLKFVSGVKISGSDWNDVRLYRPASYIVYKEGTQFYALGQYSGSTDYSGSNASTVIQAAIDALSGSAGHGGKIFIHKGWYYLPTGLSITQQGITIEGESVSFNGFCGQQGPILYYTGSGALFTYTGSGNRRFFGEIKNLELCGGFSGSYGIDVQGWFSDLWFDKLFILEFGTGVKLQANAGAGVEGKIWNIWFLDCVIEGSTDYGIWMTNTESWTHNSIDRVSIIRGHYSSNKNSIRIDEGHISNILIDGISVENSKQQSLYLGGGIMMIITNNRIFDCGKDSDNTYPAVYMYQTGSLGPIEVIISNNCISNHLPPYNQKYAVHLSGSLLQAQIFGNAFDSGSATGIMLIEGEPEAKTLIIKNNRKYITEKSGYASGSSGDDFLHGLAETATNIRIEASGSNPMLFSTVASGSAGFYVYHTGSGMQYFFWKANTKYATY